MSARRSVGAVIAIVATCVLLAYLRDPPWLIDVTSGIGGWRAEPGGGHYRAMQGRGSFFVPSDAASIAVPVRARFDSPMDGAVTATFTVDDRPADKIVLSDGNWHTVTIQLRRPTSRRVRRIDIRVDRTRYWNYGLDIGPVEVRYAP